MAMLGLIKLRESKGLTRKQLADGVGITERAIEYYEKGKRKPTFVIAKKLCDFFGCVYKDLE